MIHLWLGLASGLFLAFVSLTGSLIVFEEPLDRLISPSFFAMKSESDRPPVPLSEVVRIIQGEREGLKVKRIDFRHAPRGPYIVHVIDSGTDGNDVEREFSVDQYAGVVIGERSLLNPMGLIWRLHVDLLLGETGRTILGVAAIVLIVSSVTGLVLWWPKRGKVRQAFTVKSKASRHRLQVDLHRVTGAYLVIPLFIASLTGVMIIWPQYTFPVIAKFLEIPERAFPAPRDVNAALDIGPDAIPGLVRAAIPTGQIRNLHFPTEQEPYYWVSIRSFENGHPRGRSYVAVYKDDGERWHISETRGAPLGYQLRWEWLVPLHSGDILYFAGKSAMLLAGLAPTVFLITGFFIWRNKSRARRKRAGRHA